MMFLKQLRKAYNNDGSVVQFNCRTLIKIQYEGMEAEES